MVNILLADPSKVPLNELKQRRKNEANGRIRERLSCIIASIEEQKSGKELAKRFDYGDQTIHRWIKGYNLKGIAGLSLNSTGGRPRKVNGQEEAWVLQVLEQQSPREYGFVTETWDCKMLAKVYSETWKKQISDETIRRLLKRNYYSFKQPQFQHPKADVQAKKKRDMNLRTWKR